MGVYVYGGFRIERTSYHLISTTDKLQLVSFTYYYSLFAALFTDISACDINQLFDIQSVFQVRLHILQLQLRRMYILPILTTSG